MVLQASTTAATQAAPLMPHARVRHNRVPPQQPQHTQQQQPHRTKSKSKNKNKSTNSRTRLAQGNPTPASDTEEQQQDVRAQLMHALAQHAHQVDEIAALRAVAKSLALEVDAIRSQPSSLPPSHLLSPPASARSHTFFARDLEFKQLHDENATLRDELRDSTHKLAAMQTVVSRELPAMRAAAVRARAELACVASQLRDERQHCDRLEARIAKLAAREHVRAATHRKSDVRSDEAVLWLQCHPTNIDDIDSDSESENVGRSHRRDDEAHDDNESSARKQTLYRQSQRRSSALDSSRSSSKRSQSVSSSHESTSLHRSGAETASAQVLSDLSGLERELQALHAALPSTL